MAAGSTRRRWFSFSLRTLFVVVTLLGVCLGWLAWHAHAVHVRNITRSWVAEHHGWLNPSDGIWSLAQEQKDAELSWIRHALGDRAAVLIELPIHTVSLDEIQAIEAAFPEATAAVGAPFGPEPVGPLRDDGVTVYHWPPKPGPMPK